LSKVFVASGSKLIVVKIYAISDTDARDAVASLQLCFMGYDWSG
jgi:hypothetical protein